MKAKYVFRTDLDGSVILTADGSGRYNIQSLKSELTVAVPEWDIALAASSLAVLAVVFALGV